VCQEFKGHFEKHGNAFVHITIIVDKSWVFQYNATTKEQN
jgi:hypothetical protein